MPLHLRSILAAGTLCAAALLASSCTSRGPAPSGTPATAAASMTNTTTLLGDMKPLVSVKELMQYMIDPASDYIFDSVKTIIRPNGTVVEVAPKSDEDWEKLRVGAVTLAEGVYLLKVQRPFTPPGDVNNSVGPDATVLPPDQNAGKDK